MIGIDIVNIEKFKEKLEKKDFESKIFTDNEIHYSKKKKNSLQTFAGIFAAKEAIIKACGFNLAYILRKKIEIKHKGNKPIVFIDKNEAQLNLSISHDGNYALAICLKKENYIEINKSV